nr:uncharacterized protein LOC116434923 [Nomia melanderi]
MAEKYVKDILEKLEEIEGLHAKLRSLVPRMRNYEAGSGSNGVHGPSKSEKKSDHVTLEEKQGKKNSWKRKLSDIGVNPGRLKSTRGSKYLKRLRRSSLNFVVGQWRDKKERIKNLLAGLVENDVILGKNGRSNTRSESFLFINKLILREFDQYFHNRIIICFIYNTKNIALNLTQLNDICLLTLCTRKVTLSHHLIRYSKITKCYI